MAAAGRLEGLQEGLPPGVRIFMGKKKRPIKNRLLGNFDENHTDGFVAASVTPKPVSVWSLHVSVTRLLVPSPIVDGVTLHL